ncbi:MAG: hypothetical protein NAOJABEB_00030 [Steroidobacteraceae bacterium]|nr:hypothetical protein [Steroidobacteraceae bacterium]
MRFTLLAAIVMLSQATMAQTTVPINVERAKVNYRLNCQGCHLADGSGLPGVVPTMKGLVGNFLKVPGGRDFLVQVPGSAFSPLSDADLAELLNWILATMSDEHKAPDFEPYTEAEVQRTRRRLLADVAKTREALINSQRATSPHLQ